MKNSTVSVTIVIINHKGEVNNLLQRKLLYLGTEYKNLKKKYIPDEKDTSYSTIKVKYNPDKRHKIVWIETPLKV